MASGWTSEEISKPLPSGWTANPDGQTCYLSAGFFSFFRRRAPVEQAMFSSNCDHLKIYVDGKLVAEADPDREQFPHLRYAPFTRGSLEGRFELGRFACRRLYSGPATHRQIVFRQGHGPSL